MKAKKKKRPVTLIEIMIVILLIGLIGGALAFNMRGSVDEGKVFKTRQNIARIEDILMLEYVKGEKSLDQIANDWRVHVLASPLVKGEDIIKDGWNVEFTVKCVKDELVITSKKYTAYTNRQTSGTQK